MTLAQARELVEGDSFSLDLLSRSTTLEQLVAIPSPCTFPLPLRVHLQRVEYHSQGARSTECCLALCRKVSHEREIALAISFFKHLFEHLLSLGTGEADQVLRQLAAVEGVLEIQVVTRRLLGREASGIIREWK